MLSVSKNEKENWSQMDIRELEAEEAQRIWSWIKGLGLIFCAHMTVRTQDLRTMGGRSLDMKPLQKTKASKSYLYKRDWQTYNQQPLGKSTWNCSNYKVKIYIKIIQYHKFWLSVMDEVLLLLDQLFYW